MKLRQIVCTTHTLCTPLNYEDLALFKHCTGGDSCCIKQRVYGGDVGMLLSIHGVPEVDIVDSTLVKHHALEHRYIDGICPICGHSEVYAQKYSIKCFKNKLCGSTREGIQHVPV